MQRLSDLLQRSGILPGLVSATTTPLYLVGGAVRDTLVQRPIHDLDLVTPDDPTPLARKLARRMQAHWFMLDKERGQSRVLLPGDEALTIDFAPFRAPTLHEDLCARDFTLNALAFDLQQPLTLTALIDPLGGRDDLSRGILRVCAPTVLQDDPLRLLRGVRYLLEFDLTPDPESERWLQQAAPLLSAVAGERRCSELARLLGEEQWREALPLLRSYRLWPGLLGCAFTEEDEATLLPLLAEFERRRNALAGEGSAALKSWFDAAGQDGLSGAALVRLALTLRAMRRTDSDAVSDSLRLGRRTRSALRLLLRLGEAQRRELQRYPLQGRGARLWAESLAPAPVAALLMLLVLAPELPLDRRILELFEVLLKAENAPRLPPLLDGGSIGELMAPCDGKEIGRWQAMIRQKELEGVLLSRQDAINYLKLQNEKMIDKEQVKSL